MVQERVAHLESLKLRVEVTIFISIKRLVVAYSVSVILADDADGGRFNRLSSIQVPRPIVLTALAVDKAFHHHISHLLCWFWGRVVGVRQEGEQGEEEERKHSEELTACHR